MKKHEERNEKARRYRIVQNVIEKKVIQVEASKKNGGLTAGVFMGKAKKQKKVPLEKIEAMAVNDKNLNNHFMKRKMMPPSQASTQIHLPINGIKIALAG